VKGKSGLHVSSYWGKGEIEVGKEMKIVDIDEKNLLRTKELKL